ncbi:MAG: DUF4010 domain-containing protein [Saprospiraceae bacterium]|nr:DUF4010 domain-containing protein [Saprospiraceae bacterium]
MAAGCHFSHLAFPYLLPRQIPARDRSILLTGILGVGLQQATAWFFARRSRSDAGSADLPAAAIIFASSLMFVRILVWLAFLSPEVVPRCLAGHPAPCRHWVYHRNPVVP